ncbi:unnamed protein product [Euphydryas editha]|uniref:Reverse transcriptase domain-containing protein n=1 Tax=Euphydryas editha TaxID=104508 RepID=A0AAU9TD74_EUPED|nr:unnamed protein product [Euphydryas editha]
MFVREDICCRRLLHLEDRDLSILWVRVDYGGHTRVYACLYRSHSGDRETKRLFEHLQLTTDKVLELYPSTELVILGDFNAHHTEWLSSRSTDYAGRCAHEFALAYGYSQLVHSPTRIPDIEDHTSSILDLLLTQRPDGYSISVDAPLGSSDHCLIRTLAPCTRADPPRPTSLRRIWQYKSADWDGLREYYASYPWRQLCFTSEDPDTCAAAVSETILAGMEYFIPNSLVAAGTRKRPWFNRPCKEAKRIKQATFRAWTTARSNSDPNVSDVKRKLNAVSRSCKRAIARAKFEFIGRIGERLANYPSGSRAFWSLAKAAEGNFCLSSLPPLQNADGNLAHSAKEKADLLGTLFASNSTLNVDESAVPPTIPRCGHSMPEISFSQRDVRRELLSLDVHKSSGPDGIPAIVLKQCAPELCPVLTRLFALSYHTRQVPSSWKTAHVHPVPKKGDRSDPSNYRPIAITSLLSKVMERVINTKLLRYLEEHDLISDRQYGFRHGRSTGDLLVYLTHRWASAIESQGEALAVSLDMAKAFDRVWHRGLLSKLPSYGLPEGLCKWVASFLSGRCIRAVVDGCCSAKLDLNAGVPQGSVLSPTLFLLHINDLLSIDGIHCYADDSTGDAFYTGRANIPRSAVVESREQLVSQIESSLSKVSDWGRNNLVQFNPSKTQVCAFTAKKTPFTVAPQFQDTTLTISNSIGILGIDISSDVQFRCHLEDKVKMASKKLGVLNRAKRYFTPGQRLLLYKSQVRPHMEYCSHLWAGAPAYQLGPLDSVQRRAVRIVDDPILTSDIEPLSLRRDLASLCVLYRLYNGLCSEELFEMMPTAAFYHRTARHRQGIHAHTLQPKWSRTVRYQRNFLPRTIRLWNELPAEVFPQDYSMGSFKRGVNRFLKGRQRACDAPGVAGVHRLR